MGGAARTPCRSINASGPGATLCRWWDRRERHAWSITDEYFFCTTSYAHEAVFLPPLSVVTAVVTLLLAEYIDYAPSTWIDGLDDGRRFLGRMLPPRVDDAGRIVSLAVDTLTVVDSARHRIGWSASIPLLPQG